MKHFARGYDVKLTSALMAPALKLWWYWGLFLRAKHTKVGKGCPSMSTALGSLTSVSIYELGTTLLTMQKN